ncbi:MAG: ISAs1 family transposase [Planctomycetota bacterium]|jgi:predicted transposase YbfD/YdcC
MSISAQFGGLEDPRNEKWVRHSLQNIITIAICAAICGAEDWVAVEAFGQAKREWLEKHLDLSQGIPSHDTFNTVFNHLDPEAFQHSFINWIKVVGQVTEGEVVPIDGKQLRRSHDKGIGQTAIHMVSAWANQANLVLGQVKVDDKSNEITAIPVLLELLALTGCIVTIDAMGCQTEIAQTIVAQQADYVLALKENQGQLYHQVADLFATGLKTDFQHIPYQFHQTFNKGHGRLEWRRCWTIDEPAFIQYLDPQQRWPQLTSVVMIQAERTLADQTSVEYRYYISSLPGDPQHLLQIIRQHWGIENKLHWVLDVAFGEDLCRVRRGYGPQNFAVLRHIALNLLKQEFSDKRGIHNKRLRAGWDEAYLELVLASLT